MKDQIQSKLQKIISQLGVEDIEIKIDIPDDPSHGDYSSNIALVLFAKLKSVIPAKAGIQGVSDSSKTRITSKNPRELAKHLILEIGNLKLDILDRVEVAGAGFVNFYLSQESLLQNLEKIHQEKEKFGANSQDSEPKKVMVEFTDPNPFKEFHIGHLYSNTVGESLSRLFESQGGDIMRVCYQGDVGLHVAKALYGVKNHESRIKAAEQSSIQEKAKFLGQCYAMGARAYEESAKDEIHVLNKKIYDRSDPNINKLYDLGKKWSLEYFETIYARLGTRFKKYYFESEVGQKGIQIVRENIGNVFKEDNGAVIFPGEEYGLHTRVFINSLGLPTYEAKELGLAPTKYTDFPYDLSVIVTGNEINEYFRVLLKALSLIKPDLASKTHHIGHGMVRLPSGKMSSRTGDVITGEWLLDTARDKILALYPEMDAKTSEIVAVGAVKYALLKSGIGQDITFSFDESITLDGNSGPYLQYTHARCKSILRKSEIRNSKFELNSNVQNLKLEKEEEELLRHLIHFPEVVATAAEKYSPHLLCTYLFNLAQNFNLFYQKHSILTPVIPAEAGIQDSRAFRLSLTTAVAQTLKNGLNLLGIQVPEKM